MDTNNTNSKQHQLLQLEIAARNKVNQICNEAAAKLRPYFESLAEQGVQVINADGSVNKKVRHGAEMELLFRSPDDGVFHWFEPHTAMIRFHCRTSYQHEDLTYYTAASVVVAWVEGRHVAGAVRREPLREDYSYNEIMYVMHRATALKEELKTAVAVMEEFHRFL